MPISKTDFVRGLQCKKMLWLDSHMPEEKIIPPEIQAKLDAGNEFGDKAMGIFGDFVETTAFREDGRLCFAEMLKATQRLLASGENVICEACFSWYGNFCAADILRRVEGGYALYEVKNAYAPREEFITDLGFQRLILRKSGVPLISSQLILRGDTPPEGVEIPPIEFPSQTIDHDGFCYRVVDVTPAAKITERKASECIFELGKIKKKDACMPNITVGAHCEKPYRCWYYDYCRKE